jgi:hypothetical protein
MNIYQIFSPDGFSIDPCNEYKSIKAAKIAFHLWLKRYEIQGYYSSTNYGKIDLKSVKFYCQIIKIN